MGTGTTAPYNKKQRFYQRQTQRQSVLREILALGCSSSVFGVHIRPNASIVLVGIIVEMESNSLIF